VNDALGDRMKGQYENRTKVMLPRRTYTIVRVDGKAFHNYTRNMRRPFDDSLIECMDDTASALCDGMQGAQLAYVQSDEISVLLTDFDRDETQAWFDGSLQKIVSVAASVATMAFNQAAARLDLPPTALFDARAFTIPDPFEVENYFIWRQQDAERNSLSAFCQSFFSHKELEGKNHAARHDMLHAIGQNWNDLKPAYKRGRIVGDNGHGAPLLLQRDIPVFTKERAFLRRLIPRIEVAA
jgi:tRNA(His) guanylyltransferase